MRKAVGLWKHGMRLLTNWFGGSQQMPRDQVERILELTTVLRTQAAAEIRLPGFASPSIAEESFRASYSSRRRVSR